MFAQGNGRIRRFRGKEETESSKDLPINWRIHG